VVRHAFHFGGAYLYAEQAAAAGCIGVAAANTRPLMPAPGGRAPLVGNNPIAISVPRVRQTPVTLDMALSEVALGKIRLADAEGRSIPNTWATDANGHPTTDPAAAVAGMLLPAGGAKGYGLALMVDVLTGVLSGGAFGGDVKGLYADTSVPNNCAHFFMALDIGEFGESDQTDARLATLFAQITSGATIDGVSRLLLPGQIETEQAATNRAEGVPVDASVLAGLRDAAQRVGLDLTKYLPCP
jgi:LDH2 family malate/lactate/ureidoglycolate dehydrogenase